MKSRISITDDIMREDIWASIKIPLIIEIIIFTIAFILLFLNNQNPDLIKNFVTNKVIHNDKYIEYIIEYIIEFFSLYILNILFIFGLCVYYYLKRKTIGFLLCLLGVVFVLIIPKNIHIFMLLIQFVDVIIFIMLKKKLNWWKFIIYSLWIFTLILLFLAAYLLIFIIGIIFAIYLLATSNSPRYETQDLIIQNKGYIDESTVNTKWIDEYGHEFYVNNYDKNQKTFELDGKKYKIK